MINRHHAAPPNRYSFPQEPPCWLGGAPSCNGEPYSGYGSGYGSGYMEHKSRPTLTRYLLGP